MMDQRSGIATTAEIRAPLGEWALRWLTENRGLHEETIDHFGIRTDDKGRIVFPYFDHAQLVNEKFRGRGKQFSQWTNEQGRKSTFFNADVMDAPALEQGEKLVITEGEIDCMTAHECGFHSVSVPDGAGSTKPDSKYLINNRERLKKIQWFVLAVDADEPGQKLAHSLLAYLSAASCFRVVYPKDCKDLNDVRMKHGKDAVRNIILDAKPYKLDGLYEWDDYPDVWDVEMVSTGWRELDDYIKLFRGGLTVLTGVPSHGKSTFAVNLLVNLARNHQWRSAIFSPEMPVTPFLRACLSRVLGGTSEEIRNLAQEHFVFIDADPKGLVTPAFTLDWVIEKATEAVLRYGIQCLLIDPWNEMDVCREKGESTTDYVGRALREIKAFARQRNVAVIILAHPSKAVWEKKKLHRPTLYDIADSAHFYNKCDHGLSIWKPKDEGVSTSQLSILKSRYRDAGKCGTFEFKFDQDTWRFKQPTPIADPSESVDLDDELSL